MSNEPEPNATSTATLIVGPQDLASSIASETGDSFPPVFATARMVALMEIAASRVLAPLCGPGELSVGVTVDINHTAPTPFGAEVTATTRQDMKKLLGGMAYTIMGFVKAFKLEPYEGRLILPDGVVKEGSMLIMAVGNSRFAGGGYEVAPQASVTDGLLDVAVVSGLRPDNLSRMVEELRDPVNPRNEHLLYRQLSAFTIETGKPLHVNLDGEPIKGTHFEFQCCPEALSVVGVRHL